MPRPTATTPNPLFSIEGIPLKGQVQLCISPIPYSEKDLPLCAVTQTRITQYMTHTSTKYRQPPLPRACVLFGQSNVCVCVGGLGGGYSGAQGNGTWGYSGLNGSSGYTAAHSACMSTAETNAPVHTMSRSTTKDRCVRVTKLSPRCLGFSEWQALSISCNLTG